MVCGNIMSDDNSTSKFDGKVRILILLTAARAHWISNGFRYCPALEHLVDFFLLAALAAMRASLLEGVSPAQ